MKTDYRTQLMIFGALALVFAVGGIVALFFGVGMYFENRAFSERAESAPGKVVGFEKWEPQIKHDDRDVMYYAMVAYTMKDGREIEFRGPSKDGLVKLKEGDAVRVLYEPSDPEAARVDSFMGLWFGAAMLCGVGAGAVIIPLLTMWQAWTWTKRRGPG